MNAFETSPLPLPSARRSASTAWSEAIAATAGIERDPQRVLYDVLAEVADASADRAALLSDRETLTFTELIQRARSYAGWAESRGLQPGAHVALIMSNRPEYVAAWLGLTRMGLVVALINTSLTGPSLAHCLKLASPAHVILEDAYLSQAGTCRDAVLSATLWLHGNGDAGQAILPALAKQDGPSRFPSISIDDTALLIYTSGTTGLPKAARVTHRRILNWALWFKGLLGNTSADRMYDCLPLFHSVGGVVAVTATLVAGGSTVIAERFSASRFWNDIRRWECTQFQYIGELCRYLLNAPSDDLDGLHRLRLAVGNGLRGDVWEAFAKRFAIPQIVEFYAATEGNFSLYNVEGKPGAIGRVPGYLRHRFPTAIVRHDVETGQPLRGEDGLCLRVAPGEAGEAIGRIGDGRDGSGRFEGYTNAQESERKILRDVFVKGDMWFRTGDLMRCDAAGYYYFVDRIGDTFRWKGENVSTLEVGNALASCPGVEDAVVYGVAVPGADGKAGMAFLQTGTGFDLGAFRKHAEALLPAYAIPLFLRLGSGVSLTDTFKHRKTELMAMGFEDRSGSGDVYVWNVETGSYVRLDPELAARIARGGMRF